MPKKAYAYAQLEAIALEMRRNKDMVYFYEYDVPIATSPTGEVMDLVKEFGMTRTSGRGWAIDEHWLVGATIGVAAAGSPAIVRLPSLTVIYAIEYIYNQAGKLRSMTGGQASMPFVLWQGGGSRSKGSAGQHTDVGQEALYANLPGIKVVVPSNAYDAKGLMIAAIRNPDQLFTWIILMLNRVISLTCQTRLMRFRSGRRLSGNRAMTSLLSHGLPQPST